MRVAFSVRVIVIVLIKMKLIDSNLDCYWKYWHHYDEEEWWKNNINRG